MLLKPVFIKKVSYKESILKIKAEDNMIALLYFLHAKGSLHKLPKIMDIKLS